MTKTKLTITKNKSSIKEIRRLSARKSSGMCDESKPVWDDGSHHITANDKFQGFISLDSINDLEVDFFQVFMIGPGDFA
jgi:hypothetical protein